MENQNLPERSHEESSLVQELLSLTKTEISEDVYYAMIQILEDSDWYIDQLKVLPDLEDIPMICKGSKCPYAQQCPIMRGIEAGSSLLIEEDILGKLCQVEIKKLVKHFAFWCKTQRIRPEDYTDVVTVVGLVRLLIIKDRLLWDLNIHGTLINQAGVVVQATKQVLTKKEANPILDKLVLIEKQIEAFSKQLMSSRRDRVALAEKSKGLEQFFDLVNTSKKFDPDVIEPFEDD